MTAQVAALEGDGHEVCLVSRFTDDYAEQRTYKLRSAVTVATDHGYSPLPELKQFRPDIVHVHNLFPNYSSSWLHQWDGPLVATLHNYRSTCAAGTLYRNGSPCTECIDSGSHRAVVHRCYKQSGLATLPLAIRTRNGVAGDNVIQRADRLIALSNRSYDIFRSLGIATAKMALLPNFVDGAPYSPHSVPGDHWVYIGRLTEEKGILTLIHSWPSGQSLHIIGDGPLRDEILSHVDRSPNIRFVGPVSNSEVPKILAEAKGLVFPSEWPEGAPIVYVEALAAGRPVLARAGNSVADDVLQHGTGVVYSNAQQLEIGLQRVTNNWRNVHDNALLHFEEHYSMESWVKNLVSLYEACIEGGRLR